MNIFKKICDIYLIFVRADLFSFTFVKMFFYIRVTMGSTVVEGLLSSKTRPLLKLHPLPPVVIPPLASGYRPESRRLRLPDVHQSSSDCRRGKLDTQWKEELKSDLENRSKMTSFPRLLVQSPISRDIAIYQLRKMAQERGSKGFLAQEMTGKDRFLPELPQKGNRPTQNLKVLQVRRPIGLTWKQWKGTERAHLISMKGEFSETPQPVQSKKTPKFQKQREIILEDNLKDKLQERMDNLRGKDDTVKKEYLNEIFDSEKQEKSQKNDKDNRSVIKEDISTISADNIPSNFFGEMSTNSSSSTYLFKQLSDG
ncbi:uncharacterized protein [Lepisosteus oculatus]|uniref:uncharacterized protein n=1 Tax=Lepisosteus oculatus TaxID=7918 RepID=UPI0037238F66